MLVAKKKKTRYDSELTSARERVCAKGRKRGGKRGTECANRRSEGRDFSEKVADTNRRSIEAFGETTTRVCVCVCGLPQIDFLFNLVIVINVQSLARSTSNF